MHQCWTFRGLKKHFLQVKQELHPQEEEEEVICIKEEPEEQQVMATLEQQSCPPESEVEIFETRSQN